MDTKNFSNLLIKIAGIIIVIVSITNIPYYIPYYQTLSLQIFFGTVIIPVLLPVLIGIFMFTRPGIITNKVVIDESENINKIGNDTLLKLEQIVLSALGFYLLFQATSDIVFHTTSFMQAKSSITYAQRATMSNSLIFTPDFIASIGELLFALWLILQTKGIVFFINKIRTAGNKDNN